MYLYQEKQHGEYMNLTLKTNNMILDVISRGKPKGIPYILVTNFVNHSGSYPIDIREYHFTKDYRPGRGNCDVGAWRFKQGSLKE